ncbi:CHAT domain-containing protein [Suillus lakei]|nr:CHAT domain-containing protein [Suillus lakei]
MPGSLEGQSIRLEVVSGKNISSLLPHTRRSPAASSRLSLEIRASFELDRVLGHGELIGKLETSWNELDRGTEPFDLSFPSIRGSRPSLTLTAVSGHALGNDDDRLSDPIFDSEIAQRTDAGHTKFVEFVTSNRFVLDRCPVGHPDRSAALANLAWARFEGDARKDLQDIESTTSLFRDALVLRPQGHPDHVLSLYHFIRAMIWHYKKECTAVNMHEFVQLCCKLLLCPEGTHLRSISEDNSVDYIIRECNKLSIDASDEGIRFRRMVLELCPLGHQRRPSALDKLSRALCARFQQSGSVDVIDESIKFGREAVSLYPEGHHDRDAYLVELAFSFTSRFRHQGKLDDLDEAISLCDTLSMIASDESIRLQRMVLELCPLGHQRHPSALDKLSRTLCARFQQSGSVDDIDDSIQYGREAVSLCHEEHHRRDAYLGSLAFSLKFRFEHQGKSHDLNESISLYEEVLRLCPVGHNFRDASLDNLGGALLVRFNQCGNIDDISRAISLCREALTLRPRGHSRRHTTLANLAYALNTRYDTLHVSDDIDEAIDLLRESLRLKLHGHPGRHVTLIRLSSALCSHFKETQKNEDIEEAIGLCRKSLATLPPLRWDRYVIYMALHDAYLLRYRIQHKPADLSLAIENIRLASQHPSQGFHNRIRTALHWIDEAEEFQHESAMEAYHMCLDLCINHMMTRPSIISRREATAAFRGVRLLPVNAVSCAIRRDDLRQAVELVERGRGQQWSLACRLRIPLEDLESINPNLAHKLSELSKRLSDHMGSVASMERAAADKAVVQYRRLTEQWEAVVSEIRNLQGFSRFFLPPSYEDLQAAARHGPVIIFIASKYLCSAIVVLTSGEPHHKVWDKIMLLIVNLLQHGLKLKIHSRIWLCPTAAFTFIPLHGAHPFRIKADRSKEPCLEDLFICSYTPTLSALIRSRQAMKTCVTPSFVAIGQGQPDARKCRVLLAADSELELVRKLVPATVTCTVVSGDAATRAGALEALQQNTWVHLACHGKRDHTQPYYSHFVTKDEPLTLLDIMEKDIPHAEFAFLSTCHTAVGHEETPDEVIHLAAGLQFSGFKSIIGTLWEVDDTVAKHVVEAFYKNIFKNLEDGGVMDCTKAAWALKHATHAVKTKVPLEQRMGFIHIVVGLGLSHTGVPGSVVHNITLKPLFRIIPLAIVYSGVFGLSRVYSSRTVQEGGGGGGSARKGHQEHWWVIQLVPNPLAFALNMNSYEPPTTAVDQLRHVFYGFLNRTLFNESPSSEHTESTLMASIGILMSSLSLRSRNASGQYCAAN